MPLPPLTLPTRPKPMAAGDSYLMQANAGMYVSALGQYPNLPLRCTNAGKGTPNWAMWRTMGAINPRQRINLGMTDSGKLTDGWNRAFASEGGQPTVNRFYKSLKREQPDLVFLQHAISVIMTASSSPVTQVVGYFKEMIEAARDFGAHIIVFGIGGYLTPRTSSPDPRYAVTLPLDSTGNPPGVPLGDPRRGWCDDVDDELAKFDQSSGHANAIQGCHFVDLRGVWFDANRVWFPGFSEDGVHPAQRAAQLAGNIAYTTKLNGLISPLGGYDYQLESAAFNFLANADLSGTGGVIGHRTSGVAPDGWAVSCTNPGPTGGFSCVSSIINSGADKTLNLDFTPGGAYPFESWKVRPTAVPARPTLPGGRRIPDGTEFQMQIECLWSNWNGWRTINPVLEFRSTNNLTTELIPLYQVDGNANDRPDLYSLNGQPNSIVLRTPPMPLMSNVNYMWPYIQIDVSNVPVYGSGAMSGVGTFRMKSPKIIINGEDY